MILREEQPPRTSLNDNIKILSRKKAARNRTAFIYHFVLNPNFHHLHRWQPEFLQLQPEELSGMLEPV